MKMLFSYNFFTFFQLSNKFYNRKIQNIHLTQPKIKIKTSFIHKLGERRKKEWEIEGKRDRSGKRGSEWMEAAVASGGLRNGFAEWVHRSGGFFEWVHWSGFEEWVF